MRHYFTYILTGILVLLLLTSAVFATETDLLADSLQGDLSSVSNPYFVGTLKTSANCIEMLKDMEGYLPKPHSDYGQQSIGYGCNAEYLKKYHKNLQISDEDLQKVLNTGISDYILKKEKAEALMMYVLLETEQKLDQFLDKNQITVNQYQYDSLISFTYNLGYAWMKPDTRLGEVLIAGDYTVNEFASAMGVYCHATVDNEPVVLDLLIDRRIREIKLFLYGAYRLKDTEVKFCTLRYDAGDGEAFTDIGFYEVGQPYQHLFDAEATENTLPYFEGWYDENGEPITASSIVEKSIVVTAAWSDEPCEPELVLPGTIFEPTGPQLGETEYGGGESEEDNVPQVDITTVFSDMKADDWHYAYVAELYNKTVINGYPDGTFRPDSIVTTGEALKMILLAAGYETPEPVASHWARNFLNLALEMGLIDRGDITDLDIPITRALMAKIVVRALVLASSEEPWFFTDTDDPHAQILYEHGISDGYPDGTFRPHRNLTRAELSAIVCRMYDC